MSNFKRSEYARQIRANLVRTLASEPQPNARHRHCTVACGNLTESAAGRGLSQNYCHNCRRKLARNGSAFRKSYTAAELAYFMVTAERWLKQNKDKAMVKRVEAAVSAMLSSAGQPQISTRMIRTSAAAKATNALARLRVRGIKPLRIIAITLAVHALAESRGDRGREWLHVQTARVVHRKAARFTPPGMEDKKSAPGTKLKWGHEVYGPSSGPFKKLLGQRIVEIAGLLFETSTPFIIDKVRQRQVKAKNLEAPT
jgi:hypothetical protein